MLRAKLGNKIIIGLSARNVELLRQGKPIIICTDDLGIPDAEIVVMYGETEQQMLAELEASLANHH